MASKGLEALAPNGLKSQGYTVSNYPRDNLTPATRGILDALAANPKTANIGVKSGYRDPARNARAGGAKKSQHMKGNAVDLDISGLSAAQKKEALDTAIAAGAKGIGVYASGNSLHVDPRANPTVWGQLQNAYKGLTKAQFGLLPDWARPSIDALFGGFNPQPNPDLPDTMSPPQTRAQVEALDRVAQAYRDPMRALDVVPSKLTPAALERQYSQYRPSLDVARPSPMPGALAPASTFKPDNINRSLFGRDSFAPAPASTARPAPAPTGLPAARQQTTVATRPSTPATTGLPAASTSKAALADAYGQYGDTRAQAAQTQALADQYGQYRPSTVTSMPTVAGMPSIPAPTGLPAAKPVAQPLQHPISVPTPPAAITPPAPVLAPALVQPRVVQDRPIASVQTPPQAPRATAYDVYNGLADKALDNSGMNTVGRLPDGTTTVTNKYGVTTGMTPYGKQTAVGSLPGITGPTASKFGGAIKGAIPGVAGASLGGLLGGPIGALIGAALAKAATQPGGLLSGQQSFQTNAFGTINAAKAQGGHAFPDAPSGGYGSGGSMGASFSNRSADGMRGISPGAAAAIGAGKGGLY